MRGDKVQRWVAWRIMCCYSCTRAPLPGAQAGSSSHGTGDQTRRWGQGMKLSHSPPCSPQPSPSHSKSTGSSGASRAVGQEGRQAQELWFTSGSTSFDDIRARCQKHPTTSQDTLWDNHPGHTCVTGDDRSYSRCAPLCIALEKNVMQALEKLPQIPVCF